MNEAALTKKIQAAIKARGLLCFKWHGTVMGQTGMPDLLVIVNGQAVWLEVKTEAGDTTKLQEHMLGKLRAAGCFVAVVRSLQDAMDAVDVVECDRS